MRGSYKVEWKKSAVKELKKIDSKYIHRIIEAVEPLTDDPFPPQTRKLVESKSSYRIRIGDYRVVYGVDTENKIISIYRVRHRKDAYRNF
ncbi:MAG: addiction module toxin RelE [Candidatus Altiarchaeales archaeon IMC4]|nr:MAG: addiction module toxin RelE [Candidatus Altiarchaeales archaeon IMC4]